MMFNLTLLEILLFLLLYLFFYLWLKFGRRLRRRWRDYFRQRRGPRSLKPKAPDDCPACNQLLSLLPVLPKPEVVPWSDRKRLRGQQRIRYWKCQACGGCRTLPLALP